MKTKFYRVLIVVVILFSSLSLSADAQPAKSISASQARPSTAPGCSTGNNTTFTDIYRDDPWYEQVYYAACKGYISGYSNGNGTYRFEPLSPVRRGEATKMIDYPFRWTYVPNSELV